MLGHGEHLDLIAGVPHGSEYIDPSVLHRRLHPVLMRAKTLHRIIQLNVRSLGQTLVAIGAGESAQHVELFAAVVALVALNFQMLNLEVEIAFAYTTHTHTWTGSSARLREAAATSSGYTGERSSRTNL